MRAMQEGPATQAETHSVLVVEDDQAVAELLRTLLGDECGWSVTVAHSAAAARAAFRRTSPEVLVLDINLPDGNGLQLLEGLRREPQWHAPAVVLISAVTWQPGIQRAISSGARFIAKPFDVDDLVEAVEAGIAQYDGTAGSHPRDADLAA